MFWFVDMVIWCLYLSPSDFPPSALLSQNDDTGLYSHLTGVPKALLPGTGGKKILDFWWETVNMCVTVAQTLLCLISPRQSL